MERKVHLINKRPPKPKMLRAVDYARASSGKDAMCMLHFRLIDSNGLSYRKLAGKLYVHQVADGIME